MSLKEGEPQLTMTSIFSLDDLTPFFASICDSVTRQQTKGHSRSVTTAAAPSSAYRRRRSASNWSTDSVELINSIIERDFLETVARQ